MRPLIFALVIALVAGVLGAYGFRSTRVARPVPIELARAAHAREVEVARALGFEETSSPQTRPLTGSTYGSSTVRLDGLELAAGECVAVVASAHGWGRISWLRLSRQCPVGWPYKDPNDLSVQQNVRGVVAHVQFCAWEPTFVNLCTSGFPTGEREGATSSVTYQILRASEDTIGGAVRLNRGMVTRPMPVTEPPTEPSMQQAGLDPEPEPEPTEVSPTPTEVVPTEVAPTGAVDPSRTGPDRAEVLAAMREVASQVRACHPGSPARATARVEIGNDGRVVAVSVTGVEPETASCIGREVRRLQLAPFQSPSGFFTVSFPFAFP